MEKLKMNNLFAIQPYMLGVLIKDNGEKVVIVKDNMGFIYTYDELLELEKAIKNVKELKDDFIKELNEERYDYFYGENKNNERHIRIKKQVPKNGFVYIIKKIDEDIYKIGMSKNFDERKKQISTKLHFEVETFKLFKTNDMEKLEKHFHEKFSKKRLNGEWFKLDKEDTNYIKNMSITYNGVF